MDGGRRPFGPRRRGRCILDATGSRVEEVGEVGNAESMTACDVRAQRSAARERRVTRMATLILDAVYPSVDSSGLTRCCRHEAFLWICASFGGGQ